MTRTMGPGNCIHIRFFESIEDLKSNHEIYSTFLVKEVHTAASGNTYTAEPSPDIKNMGTPNITYAKLIDGIWNLYIRFHFTTTISPDNDIPGYGFVTFNPAKEYNKEISFYNHQCFFDNDANNAIQIARSLGGGKIGQRDVIYFNENYYYLYEAQLTSAFNWGNWRLFLYSPKRKKSYPS